MIPQVIEPIRQRRFHAVFGNLLCRTRSLGTLVRRHAQKIGFFAALLTFLSAVGLLVAGLTAAAGVVVSLVPVVYGGFVVVPRVWPLPEPPVAQPEEPTPVAPASSSA
jgi:hypothetical protein